MLTLDALEGALAALRTTPVPLPGYNHLSVTEGGTIQLAVRGSAGNTDTLAVSMAVAATAEPAGAVAALRLLAVTRSSSELHPRAKDAVISMDLSVFEEILRDATTLQRACLENRVTIEGRPETCLPLYGLLDTLREFLHLTIQE